MDGFDVHPVDSGDWDDLAALFGPAGADNGCWCQYWLLGAGYRRRDREENRADLRRQVGARTAGLLARSGSTPVGWARLGPRSDLGWLRQRFARTDFPDDDPWSLSCFFVGRRHRGRGVMMALVQAAVRWAGEHGVPLEGYPIDPSVPGATRNRFPGVLPVFEAAGFVEQGRLAKDRALVRAGWTETSGAGAGNGRRPPAAPTAPVFSAS